MRRFEFNILCSNLNSLVAPKVRLINIRLAHPEAQT
jgi:hypothetical protein